MLALAALAAVIAGDGLDIVTEPPRREPKDRSPEKLTKAQKKRARKQAQRARLVLSADSAGTTR